MLVQTMLLNSLPVAVVNPTRVRGYQKRPASWLKRM